MAVTAEQRAKWLFFQSTLLLEKGKRAFWLAWDIVPTGAAEPVTVMVIGPNTPEDEVLKGLREYRARMKADAAA